MFQAAELPGETARLLYLAFGETDDWAMTDDTICICKGASLRPILHRLWDFAQASPAYKDKTSIVVKRITDEGPDRATGKAMAKQF
jgi:hypothetical protein